MSEFDFEQRMAKMKARYIERLVARAEDAENKATTWRYVAGIGWGALAIVVGCLILVRVGWL